MKQFLKLQRIVRVTCHAAHPDPRRVGQLCGQDLPADILGPVRFVATSRERPKEIDGRIRIQCSRRECQSWNVFELVPE